MEEDGAGIGLFGLEHAKGARHSRRLLVCWSWPNPRIITQPSEPWKLTVQSKRQQDPRRGLRRLILPLSPHPSCSLCALLMSNEH
jgi:hypothetical protein